MAAWTQKGFAAISDLVLEDGRTMPFLHSFAPARWGAEWAVRKAAGLPEHLRRNIRIVAGELSFDAGNMPADALEQPDDAMCVGEATAQDWQEEIDMMAGEMISEDEES